MKIKAGEQDIPMVSFDHIVAVRWKHTQGEDTAHWHMLLRVQPEEIFYRRHKDPHVVGIPMYFACAHRAETLLIFPAPATDSELKVRYCPPIEEV